MNMLGALGFPAWDFGSDGAAELDVENISERQNGGVLFVHSRDQRRLRRDVVVA